MRISIPIAGPAPLEFELPAGIRLVDCSRPQVTATLDWCGQLAHGLASPLGYPPISQAILPGDRVAIPISPETPQAATALRVLLHALFAAESPPQEVDLLYCLEMDTLRSECESLFPPAWSECVRWIAHDPAEDPHSSLVGVTREGRPLYVHRTLGEADVVLPLGVARPAGDAGDWGIHGGWFPLYSNRETRERFFAVGNLRWDAHHRRRCEETREAAWMLGVQCAVQLLPSASGGVLNAWCGGTAELEKATAAAYRQAWQWEWETEVDAAVAVIDGPAATQSWRNVAQALLQAARVVRVGGTIIVATQLTTPPGPALSSVARDELSPEAEQLALLRLRSADGIAAQIIRDCLETHRLFLQTQLADGSIEELGCGAWHTTAELERLLREHESCVVIGSAQYASLQLKT